MEVATRDGSGLDSLDVYFTQLSAQPEARLPCAATTLVVQSPAAMAYGGTGSHAFGFTIANIGHSTCTLGGYLRLTITDDAGRLPFKQRHGGSQFWQDPGAHPVKLAPGQVAVVVIDKYRCDSGVARKGTRLRITLPGLPPVSMSGEVDYCQQGTGDDPGNILTMTAIAPSMAAIYRLPP
jgi:hypothetical protein